MANTTNFGWETPDDTDLVKDGAAAMRTLGNSIDASFVDLKGGTTGQVLAKASNTDLDFIWSADAAGISPTIFDAKGDLIAASAADTAARLAVGANGTVLTADSSETTGLKWSIGGGMTLLSTTTLSGSSTTVTSISGSYTDLLVYLDKFDPTADCTVAVRFNSDSGSNYYNFGNSGNGQNGSPDTSFPFLNNVESTGTGDANAAYIHLPQYANTTTKKYVRTYGVYAHTNASDIGSGAWQALYNSTSAISSITIIPNSTTWNGGTIYIYGVK
jgi:hypothetical protein